MAPAEESYGVTLFFKTMLLFCFLLFVYLFDSFYQYIHSNQNFPKNVMLKFISGCFIKSLDEIAEPTTPCRRGLWNVWADRSPRSTTAAVPGISLCRVTSRTRALCHQHSGQQLQFAWTVESQWLSSIPSAFFPSANKSSISLYLLRRIGPHESNTLLVARRKQF